MKILRSTRNIFLVIPILFLFSSTLVGQADLFGKYSFEEGGFVLLGLQAHHTDHKISKSLGNFYTDDIAVLNSIKASWRFPKPGPAHACGYHYNILLYRNGVVLGGAAINLDCNEIATKEGSYIFDGRLLSTLKNRVKPLFVEEKEFPSVGEARNYWYKINADPRFVYAQRPAWLDHEGTFVFEVPCDASDGDCSSITTDRLEKLRVQISNAYPDEEFVLEPNGGVTDRESFVRIRCNKSLEEKFTIYPRFDNVGFGKWEPYSPWLYSFWKSKPNGNRLQR